MISSGDSFISKLKSLIDSNLTDPAFSTDTICREMGVSRSSLYRFVKEESNLSVTLFIRQYRLEKAQHLLKTTELRSVEIAELVGIPNPQNFSKYFTEAYAVSPTEFRKLQPETGLFVSEPPENSTDPERGTPKTVSPSAVNPQKRNWRRSVSMGLVLALLTGLTLFALFRFGRQPDDSKPQSEFDSSIAILPFRNLGTPETQYFSEGVRE